MSTETEKLSLQQELYNLAAGTHPYDRRRFVPEVKTIVCVLNTNPFENRRKKVEYGPENVIWLKRQVEKHCRIPFRFVCLSNVDIPGVEVIPLEQPWPGWWSKVELFKHFDEAFYLDLDTVLVSDISEMVAFRPQRFMALSAMHRPKDERLNSGIMAWRGDFRFMYLNLVANPELMKQYTTHLRWGDQGYIQDQLADPGLIPTNRFGFDHIQRAFPGKVVSFKVDMECKGEPPAGSAIVCFHGFPKPDEVKAEFEWIPA